MQAGISMPRLWGSRTRSVRERASQALGRREARRIAVWCDRNSTDLSRYATQLNARLWREAESYTTELSRDPSLVERLVDAGLDPTVFPWSAEFRFLYFLVRHLEPETVVETGVSLGWSSRAILDAMNENGIGTLYSSDILENTGGPDYRDKAVGVLVEDRTRWRLFLEGDRMNLPRIMKEVDSIDIFHYDSDKSYEARSFALAQVASRLHRGSVIVMDDIKDNWHFRDVARSDPSARVLSKDVAGLRGNTAWIGLMGSP